MGGSIVITGANGSLAVHTVDHLLSQSPDSTLILTVRNPSPESDPHTKILQETVARHRPRNENVSIRQLDLASLKEVDEFCQTLSAEIREGTMPPLRGIICNAYHWNMVSPAELTADDGLEKTMQVNHVSQAALVLRLLESFDPAGGRLVFFTSDSHYPGRNGLEKYPAAIPGREDIDKLVKIGSGSGEEPDEDIQGHGFQRYANSKLAILMWTYALNRHLEKSNLHKISAIAIDPGSLTDSRALRTNTPALLGYMQKFVLQPFRPVLRFLAPDLRAARDAGLDVADLVLGRKHADRKGYIRLMVDGPSSDDSLDQAKQELLWEKTLEWARVEVGETALRDGGHGGQGK